MFNGYCLTEKGYHDGPTPLSTIAEVTAYLQDNVEKHYEIMICDLEDCCVMSVINQTLIHPIPEGLTEDNKWNSAEKKFAPVSKIILRG